MEMKHLIEPATKQIFAFAADGSDDSYIRPGLEAISDVDLAALRAEQSPVDIPALIADRRFAAEVAGVRWGEYFIATDRDSQTKVTQEVQAIADNLREDRDGWKCQSVSTGVTGFRSTTNAEMKDISSTVYRYVRACFRRENALLAAVADGTYIAEMLETGWPDNGA